MQFENKITYYAGGWLSFQTHILNSAYYLGATVYTGINSTKLRVLPIDQTAHPCFSMTCA